jgi:hypothetical protein
MITMRKNIITPEIKTEIINRLTNLKPDAPAQWGKMNVRQMLRHCSEGFLISYGEIVPSKKMASWPLRKLMRYMILNSETPAPKGKAQTFIEVDQVLKKVDPTDFETERCQLIEIVKNFPSKNTHHTSTMLGVMTPENWGRLNYTHLDHHLKQFGC